MRTSAWLVVALAACTEQERPELMEPIALTLATTDVRIVSVPVGIDCGNGLTTCSNAFHFFSNQLEFGIAKITLVVVEHPAACRVFELHYADSQVGGCDTQQLTCAFQASPGEVLSLVASCRERP